MATADQTGAVAATPATGGTIHDIGYQRYTGPRLGRGHAVRALYGYGVRTAFGLGRSGKAKVFPFLIIGILLVIAVVVAAVQAQFKVQLVSYLDFPNRVSFLLILFLAAISPELMSRDLRNKVLPLYFSRPIGRDDYVLAKLAAMVTAMLLLLGVPLFIMFLGGAFGAKDLGGAWDEFTRFLPGLVNALIYAIVLSSLALLVASLSSRRTIAAGAVVAVFLVTAPVSVVLMVLGSNTLHQVANLFNPVGLLQGVRSWLFGGSNLDVGPFGSLYLGVAVLIVAACSFLLVYRYRKVSTS